MNSAIGAAEGRAAMTATSYISTISGGGIKVHDAGDTSNYAKIDSNGLEVYRNATSVALFGATSRIGRENGSYISLKNNELYLQSGGVGRKSIRSTTAGSSYMAKYEIGYPLLYPNSQTKIDEISEALWPRASGTFYLELFFTATLQDEIYSFDLPKTEWSFTIGTSSTVTKNIQIVTGGTNKNNYTTAEVQLTVEYNVTSDYLKMSSVNYSDDYGTLGGFVYVYETYQRGLTEINDDIYMGLETSGQSGTADDDLYAAIQSLGWTGADILKN
jgi:hypothetical protein